MGATKSDFFSTKQNSTAAIFKALGHPARIAIIDYLLKKETCICGDIVGELSLAQPTISQHLKELKSAGLIKGTVSGTSICYCLDETAFSKIKDHFTVICNKINIQQSCC